MLSMSLLVGRLMLAVLALATLIGPACRARAAEPVNLAPSWKVGDSIDLEWVRQTTSKNPLDGQPFPPVAQQVSVKVIERTAEGVVLAWHYGRFTVNGERPAGGVADPALAALEDLTLEIQLSPALDVMGVRNADQVLARFDTIQAQQDAARPPAADPATPAQARLNEAMENARVFARTLRQNKQASVAMLLQDAAYFLVGVGWKLEPGKEAIIERETPNPFGGEPIPARWHVTLTEFDPAKPEAKSEAKLRWEQRIDAEKLNAIVRDAVRRSNQQAGNKVADAENVKIEQREVATYTIERASGWPVEGHYTKVQTIDGRTTTREYLWRRAGG